MLQYFSWQNIVPDGEGKTDKQKRRYLGFWGSVGGVRRAGGGLRTSLLFVGGGGVIISVEEMTPSPTPHRPERSFVGGSGSATPAVPRPRPSQFLRTPQRGRTAVPLRLLPAAHAQLFVCCCSFSLLRKKEEIGWRMGRRKGRGERWGKNAALLPL